MSKAAAIGPQKAHANVDVGVTADTEAVRLPTEIDAGLQEQSAKNPDLAHRVTALTRELKSVRKMVIGMAIGGYGFDRNAVRSRITKEIVSDLRLAGVPLDDATVLRHLRRATELLTEEN
jgi:hypothetical protein